jgi:hypothetical protein
VGVTLNGTKRAELAEVKGSFEEVSTDLLDFKENVKREDLC